MLKKILALSAALLCLYTLSPAQQKEEAKVSYREIGSVLPPMRVIGRDSLEYHAAGVKDGHNFFLVLFNPTCGHCIRMGVAIGEHESDFKDNKVLFLAGGQMMPYMKSFFEQTKLDQHPGIKVGIDSAQAVDRLFSYKTLPQINIYDKNRVLIKSFYGDTPLDSLRRYVH